MAGHTAEAEHSRAAVLSTIALEGPLSRSRIAERLDISPATVTAVTRELIAVGLVEMAGKAPTPGRGRPSELLGVVPEAATLLGAKVMEDHVTWVLADLRGDALDGATVPFDPRGESPDRRLGDILATLVDEVDGLLLGIGLGVPGTVDTEHDGTVTSPMFGWDAMPLGGLLSERLALPVVVDNDVNTLAVAEHLYGRGRGIDDFVTVTLGRGVGLGIFLDGAIRRGRHGGAGELGHTLAVPDGPRCDCGRSGCLEAVVAEPALVARARSEGLIGRRSGIDDLLGRANEDEAVAALYAEAGTHLGRAVARVVNLLAPGLVILSGEGIGGWPHLQAGFEPALREGVLPVHQDVEVVVDPWEDQNWARGAAALVLRSVYAPPVDVSGSEVDIRSRLHGVGTEVGS